MREILNYQYQREEVEEKINLVSETSTLVVPVQITYDMMLSIYNEFKSKYPELSAIKIVISSNGVSIRPEFNIRLRFGGKVFNTDCNITTRNSLRYTCLLGRKALKRFLTDSTQSI